MNTVSHPPITLIAAVTKNGGLGLNGQLLVEEPRDQRWLQKRCLDKPLIMGRKTFENLPPLPMAHIIVLSRSGKTLKKPSFFSQNPSEPSVEVVSSVPEALKAAKSYLAKNPSFPQEIMVLGGAQVYKAFLPLCTGVDLTVFNVLRSSDAFFPPLKPESFSLMKTLTFPVNDANPTPMALHIYRK